MTRWRASLRRRSVRRRARKLVRSPSLSLFAKSARSVGQRLAKIGVKIGRCRFRRLARWVAGGMAASRVARHARIGPLAGAVVNRVRFARVAIARLETVR